MKAVAGEQVVRPSAWSYVVTPTQHMAWATCLSQEASTSALLSLSLQLISGPFQIGSCYFHSLPSLAFLCVSSSTLLRFSPQLSKEGKEKHLQDLDKGSGKKLDKIGESDIHQYHRKCPDPFSENL